ncbi:type II toxin-antitoxin system HicB family antitoxin [candidate division TA06 bacterium]|uniref:Type II toxin-antitoxin system HicB family antitoxin n=1 Tax=candidate division TA06 bacterium TaxID=2250710 RepID=A0A933IEY3_UNCT6|nr:type II toxin-antitoxin system HicB family antitoxin [candidate division TA06 bacterium]
MKLKIIITFEDGWYISSCPSLPGCHSQGRTTKEAFANIKDAIKGYIASYAKHNEPLPVQPFIEKQIEVKYDRIPAGIR